MTAAQRSLRNPDLVAVCSSIQYSWSTTFGWQIGPRLVSLSEPQILSAHDSIPPSRADPAHGSRISPHVFVPTSSDPRRGRGQGRPPRPQSRPYPPSDRPPPDRSA